MAKLGGRHLLLSMTQNFVLGVSSHAQNSAINSLDISVDDGRFEGVQVDQPPGGSHGNVTPLLPGERLRALLALEAVGDAAVGHELVDETRVSVESLREAEYKKISSTSYIDAHKTQRGNVLGCINPPF